jgi:signal transduction histidine kinase
LRIVLEPRITVIQATITLGIAALCLVLAYTLYKYRAKSRYPNRVASLVCFALAIWLLLNGIGDRISSVDLFVVFAKSTYAYSLLVLLAFLFFVLRFPPRASRKNHVLVLSFPILLMLVSWFLIWHPDHSFTYFDQSTNKLLSEEKSPQFYFVMGSCLVVLGTAAIVSWRKWRALKKTDRTVLRRILMSFLGTGLVAVTFTLIDAYTGSTPYVFQYAYYGVGIFAITMAHSILRYGDLETSVTFKRQTILFSILACTALAIFIVAQKANELDNLTPLQLTIGSFGVAILGFISFETFLSKSSTNDNRPIAEFSNGDTKKFLNDLQNKYGLTRTQWLKADSPTGLIQNVTELQANTVDIPQRTLRKTGTLFFYEPGPQRIALIMPTSQGSLIVYRRRYNMSFTLNDFQAIRHEASLHAAALEITAIRQSRSNHVSELEVLTRQRKEQLIAANKILSLTLKKRARFFKTIISEIRAPLSLISSALQSEELKLSPATTTTIQNQSRQLLDLTEELKTATQEQHEYLPMSDWIDVQHLNAYLRNQHAHQYKEKNIALDISIYPANAKIGIQRIHFNQLTDNLISNAIKYSPEHTRITVTLSVTPGRVVLSVADEGPGISAEDHDLIFDPFYRTDQAKNLPGTGLGLSIVKRIAESYNGTARVFQRVPKGSVFEVDLSVRTNI